MEKTFDNILNTLLEEYERNPHEDINTLVQTAASQNGWATDAGEIEKTNELIGVFDKSYHDLINSKEDSGISTEAWMKKRIVAKASEVGLDEEDQTNVVEVIAEAIGINNNENLENID